MVKFQQTLRNARFIGEMAFKGLEREIRSRLVKAQGEQRSDVVSPSTTESIAVEVSEPFEGYGLLTASQIIEQSKEWSAEERFAAKTYEAATRGRRSVLQALS
jgi:hypothetical protein